MTCVHFRVGRPTTRALCELAPACEPVTYPPGLRDFLERLARGEGPLHQTSWFAPAVLPARRRGGQRNAAHADARDRRGFDYLPSSLVDG